MDINASLQDKRKEWMMVLGVTDRHPYTDIPKSDSDVNSVLQQLARMSWDGASYGTIERAREIAPPVDADNEAYGVQLNPWLHDLLDRWYVTNQMVAMRRLSDGYPITGKTGVNSLSALLKDVLKHQKLLTRQAIFDVEGLHYDVNEIKRRADIHQNKPQKGSLARVRLPENDWQTPFCRHQQIDWLAGVSAGQRKPEDVVKEDIFKNLETRVTNACEKVHLYVDKFIAHAATPESRDYKSAHDLAPTLSQIQHAHRTLWEAATFVGQYIFGASLGAPVPIAQFNKFLHIECPLAGQDQVTNLESAWHIYEEESSKWGKWGLEEYEREYGT